MQKQYVCSGTLKGFYGCSTLACLTLTSPFPEPQASLLLGLGKSQARLQFHQTSHRSQVHTPPQLSRLQSQPASSGAEVQCKSPDTSLSGHSSLTSTEAVKHGVQALHTALELTSATLEDVFNYPRFRLAGLQVASNG